MTMTDDSNGKPATKPQVPPPPSRQRRGIIAEIPKPDQSENNLSKPNSGLQDMNFKMDIDFHQEFKMAAVKRKMTMKELLEASFRCWVEHYGDKTEKN